MNNKNLQIHKWLHYFPIYERHFLRYVNRPVTLLEIGVFKGGSLEMFRNFLGPYSQIVGIDIDPTCKYYEQEQIQIRIGDQADTNFLGKICEEFGEFDIVLDDGSHLMRDIYASWTYLYSRINKNGIYMIEDLHTAYDESYGGGLKNPNSFIEISKNLIDLLNADWIRELNPTDFTKSTLSMHYYDSCLVFEKGQIKEKMALKKGI